jgi:hypothetical protein
MKRSAAARGHHVVMFKPAGAAATPVSPNDDTGLQMTGRLSTFGDVSGDVLEAIVDVGGPAGQPDHQ